MLSNLIKRHAGGRLLMRRRLKPGGSITIGCHQSESTESSSTWSVSEQQQRTASRLSSADGSSSCNFHTFSNHHHQPTSPTFASWAAVSADDDEVAEYETEKEIERITSECIAQLLPRYYETMRSYRDNSLDLELGEQSVWDSPLFEEDQDDESEDHGILEEEAFSSTSDDSALQTTSRQQTAMQILANFDPQRPPPPLENLENLQLWLECEAQQETVERFQKVIDSARERKDFSSLSIVQRQVLRWFEPLSKAIANMQKNYVLKQGENATAINVYGPFICTLPPEKLAVIVAHEAILHLLLKSGKRGQEGVTFTSLALRLGEAVEHEVVVHRVLFKRFKEAQERSGAAGFNVDDEPTTGDGNNITADGSISDSNQNRKSDKPEVNITHKWAYGASHLQRYLDEITKMNPSAKKRRVMMYAIRKARQILGKDEEWSVHDKVHLGSALIKALLAHSMVEDGGREEQAFFYEKRWVKSGEKIQSFVTLHDKLYKLFVSDKLKSFSATTTRHKPMIVPPEPWINPDRGAYRWLNVELLRYHGCNTQREALDNANLTTVFDGLNALGRVSWKINERILEVAQRCWDNNVSVGDIPSQTDFEVPPEPISPSYPSEMLDKDSPEFKQYIEERQKYLAALAKYNKIRQKNMDLRSLRCSAMLKLDQAEKFKGFDKIYFPYNMDFRGRAYPCPPHLSNVGSDLCRGMLKFSEAKALGPRGLYWLKVHLANFAGKDKMTFDDRAAFVDENMDKIRESVKDPFAGERWWLTNLEDPFQGLATCFEIVDAIDSGDPESYMCSLAVHMDGSCNGLQHYAALGRDFVGGRAVNLCAVDEPQDVYVGVMHEVIRRVAEEAERTVDFGGADVDSLSRRQKKELTSNRAAKLVNGLIDRGVVKRTVMTSVYGVTFIGARTQIQEKIQEKLQAKGFDIDEMDREIFQACGYLARVTMDVMGDLFTGAKETMNWLTTCARLIAHHGYPVAWISPIGLPAIQPYRQKKSSTLVTLMQMVTIAEEADDLPIHKQKQVSAFPPNFVHSLDSSHMLLTALEMDRRGLTFSAVHDSFWTHACDIDEMNSALRDTFVELYDQPLLERLKKTWEMRYPDLVLPDPPSKGQLNLNEVKKSKFFFQ